MKNPAWRLNLHDGQESCKKRDAAELSELSVVSRAARNSNIALLYFSSRRLTIFRQDLHPCGEINGKYCFSQRTKIEH
jgi:hypothetical protein